MERVFASPSFAARCFVRPRRRTLAIVPIRRSSWAATRQGRQSNLPIARWQAARRRATPGSTGKAEPRSVRPVPRRLVGRPLSASERIRHPLSNYARAFSIRVTGRTSCPIESRGNDRRLQVCRQFSRKPGQIAEATVAEMAGFNHIFTNSTCWEVSFSLPIAAAATIRILGLRGRVRHRFCICLHTSIFALIPCVQGSWQQARDNAADW